MLKQIQTTHSAILKHPFKPPSVRHPLSLSEPHCQPPHLAPLPTLPHPKAEHPYPRCRTPKPSAPPSAPPPQEKKQKKHTIHGIRANDFKTAASCIKRGPVVINRGPVERNSTSGRSSVGPSSAGRSSACRSSAGRLSVGRSSVGRSSAGRALRDTETQLPNPLIFCGGLCLRDVCCRRWRSAGHTCGTGVAEAFARNRLEQSRCPWQPRQLQRFVCSKHGVSFYCRSPAW